MTHLSNQGHRDQDPSATGQWPLECSFQGRSPLLSYQRLPKPGQGPSPVSIGGYQAATGTIATATALSGAVATSIYGQSVTFTASVTSSGTPVMTGSVLFTEGSSTLSTVNVNGSGQAMYSTSTLNVLGSPHTITATYIPSGSYQTSSGTTSLTVTRAPLTITADNQTKVYGQDNPTLTASYTGFVNGETAATALIGALATIATVRSQVGSYPITQGTLTAANYSITFSAANLTVTRASLTIRADNKTRVYGQPNPTLTASYSGFVNGDTLAVVSGLTLSTTATAGSGVGSYPITASGASAANYAITFTPGTLTVTPPPLTISADNKAKVYGQPNPALTATFTGLVNGDTPAVISGLTLTTTATAGSGAGSYPITPSGGTAANYTLSYVSGTLTVARAPLTISADSKTKVYGSANPALTASYSGFVNGDTPAVISGLTLTTTATAGSGVGSYPITPSGATAANYTINFTPGTLTVSPAPLTITADSKTKVYGQANPTLTASYSGFVNGDTPAVVSGLTVTSTATTGSGVGSYPITASGGIAANYTISYVAGALTVTRAALTVAADYKSRPYGQPNPALTVTTYGFVNGDTPATALTGGLATTATTSSSPGSYPITQGTLAAANYTITFSQATLTVIQAALTISADNKTKVYGQPNPALTATFTGLVNGDTPAVVTGLTLSTYALASSPVGSYPIYASNGSSPNYSITFVNGALAINRAPLAVSADNKTRPYGQINPALTVTASGFVNGDTAATALTGGLATVATSGSPAGSYPITQGTLTAGNYSITFTPGTLTVSRVALTISADNKSKVYGQPNPALTATFTGLVNGDTPSAISGLTLTTTATTGSGAGSYPITAAGGTSPNYTRRGPS